MTKQTTRQDKGRRTSILMTIGNICLFAAYFIVGTLGNSIAVISEGIDNLMDACGSLLLLLGFQISGRAKDSVHPNGHGRIEYIMGLLISELILVAAYSLGKESILRIFHPSPVTSLFPILVTAMIGTGMKMVMAGYIKKQNKEMKSSAMEAYQKNELADMKAIILVAASSMLQQFTTFPVDGVAGVVIALMIAADGLESFLRNISLLIGEGLGQQETEDIMKLLQSYDKAIQLESFEFHDYGPEEREGIMVVSVNKFIPRERLQIIIEDCKRKMKEEMNLHVSIYTDVNEKNEISGANQTYFERLRKYSGTFFGDAGRRKRKMERTRF